jgi:predicted nucleic acid-binding protein
MMNEMMLDSNVLLDVLTEDPVWYEWSSRALSRAAEAGALVINMVVYAEVSVGFDRIEDLDAALPASMFRRRPIPAEAAFLAGKCFARYRRRGGQKQAPLPDFFIGAHAAVEGMSLVTRDDRRYRTYFPGLRIVAPGKEGPA